MLVLFLFCIPPPHRNSCQIARNFNLDFLTIRGIVNAANGVLNYKCVSETLEKTKYLRKTSASIGYYNRCPLVSLCWVWLHPQVGSYIKV